MAKKTETRNTTGSIPQGPGATFSQHEEQFRAFVDSIVDYAIFMLDAEGHVITWNAGAERLNRLP